MTEDKRTCRLCHIEKPLSDFPDDRKVMNNNGSHFFRKGNCKICRSRVITYSQKKLKEDREAYEELMKKDKEEKQIQLVTEAKQIKILQKKVDKLEEENKELDRQLQLILPMINKDARKVFFEMHPHMDKFRDYNAGKPFKVYNLGTQEEVGEFVDVNFVSEELGIQAGRIQACLKGFINTVNGYAFEYVTTTK